MTEQATTIQFVITQVGVLALVAASAYITAYISLRSKLKLYLRRISLLEDNVSTTIGKQRKLNQELMDTKAFATRLEDQKRQLHQALEKTRDYYLGQLEAQRRLSEQELRLELSWIGKVNTEAQEDVQVLLDLIAKMQYCIDNEVIDEEI